MRQCIRAEITRYQKWSFQLRIFNFRRNHRFGYYLDKKNDKRLLEVDDDAYFSHVYVRDPKSQGMKKLTISINWAKYSKI